MLVRPPEKINYNSIIEFSNSNVGIFKRISELKRRNATLKALRDTAKKFTSTDEFCADTATLNFGEKLSQLRISVFDTENFDLAIFDQVFNSIFNDTVGNILKSTAFIEDEEKLEQTIVTIKILSSDECNNFDDLVNLMRIIALIKAHEKKELNAQNFKDFANAGIKLPQNIFPLKSSLTNPKKEKSDEKDAFEKKVASLYERYEMLSTAIKEISLVSAKNLDASPMKLSKAVAPNEIELSAVLNANMINAHLPLHSIVMSNVPSHTAPVDKVTIKLPVTPEFDPRLADAFGFRLTADAEKKVSVKTRTLLKEKGLSLSVDSLEDVFMVLEDEEELLITQLNDVSQLNTHYSVKNIGGFFVKVPDRAKGVLEKFPGLFTPVNPDIDKIPFTHGSIKPAGITELLIVKQNLKRYEVSDIAHIENVLKGEMKSKEHTTTHVTENFYLTETEMTSSQESSINTADRFEMNQAASEVISAEQSLKAGVGVKAKYGPAVEFSASVEGSVSRSKEKSIKHAENFSRSITQTSVEKITQRILKRESRKVIDSIEDKNKHELNNISGSEHVVGVYQWVNKVYEAQIYNYGLRTMFDFMIPEPAAFVIETMKQAYANGIDIIKPEEFRLRPDNIEPSNYNRWVKEYGATGVNPPPERYLTKSEQISQANIEESKEMVHTAEITIDEGYEAIYGFATVAPAKWENWDINVTIGMKMHRFDDNNGWLWGSNLDNETGEIPISVRSFKVESFTTTIEVKCQRTRRAMDQWRLETYNAILQAYNNKLSEYEEKLAMVKAQAGVEISGKNPVLNQIVIEDELKKHAVTLMSNQHFDMFGAIDNGTNGLPQIDVEESIAEGKYVRFFEQAFEWENMTYLFYPYFWGRKDQWVDKLNYEDVDTLFADFIKAGFSRVSVPVREGFEGAVDHFMESGEVWNGNELPAVSSEMYISIAKELSENLGRPGNEVPEGEPWEVKVPTTLVKLRSDGKLPKWKQDDNGNWIEDDD